MTQKSHDQRRSESTSAIFRRFYFDIISPAVQTRDDQFGGGCIHSSDDELAFSNLDHRLVVVPQIVDAPALRVLRHRFATMWAWDLLTIDLTRLSGPIQCELELCAPWRPKMLQICHAQMWLGGDGTVAIVTESPRATVGNLQPSALWTTKGLVIAGGDPFTDEIDRIAGIERAARALRRAETAVMLEGTVATGSAI